MLQGMAVRPVTDIVKQDAAVQRLGFPVANPDTLAAQCLNGFYHQVERAEGMVKPGMGCAGIDIFGHAKLLDTPQSLKKRMLDELIYQCARYGQKTIYRIINDLAFMHPCKIADLY